MSGFGDFLVGATIGGLGAAEQQAQEFQKMQRQQDLEKWRLEKKREYEMLMMQDKLDFETDPSNVSRRADATVSQKIAELEGITSPKVSGLLDVQATQQASREANAKITAARSTMSAANQLAFDDAKQRYEMVIKEITGKDAGDFDADALTRNQIATLEFFGGPKFEDAVSRKTREASLGLAELREKFAKIGGGVGGLPGSGGAGGRITSEQSKLYVGSVVAAGGAALKDVISSQLTQANFPKRETKEQGFGTTDNLESLRRNFNEYMASIFSTGGENVDPSRMGTRALSDFMRVLDEEASLDNQTAKRMLDFMVRYQANVAERAMLAGNYGIMQMPPHKELVNRGKGWIELGHEGEVMFYNSKIQDTIAGAAGRTDSDDTSALDALLGLGNSKPDSGEFSPLRPGETSLLNPDNTPPPPATPDAQEDEPEPAPVSEVAKSKNYQSFVQTIKNASANMPKSELADWAGKVMLQAVTSGALSEAEADAILKEAKAQGIL